MTAPADIFLSYNREDQARAKLFADGFTAQGFSVWWDSDLKAGEAYDEVTEAALRKAKAVVVLWSPRSVVSRWVRAEATLADRNKTLVPCTIEACERPIMFELTQTAELAHWRGDSKDKSWTAFLADVRRLVAWDAAPAQAAPGVAPAPIQPKAGERGERPSLAIMPFANRSGLAEDEVFSIGMVEDVIDALSLGVNVRVIASSATARFRTGANPDMDAMGRQLGVRYILEGNVRRGGESLRVAVQLVEAATGEILWTRKFDRPLVDLASLQEDLVLELAAHLDAQVHRIEMARALTKPADLNAWECVTRAQASFHQLDPDTQATGIEEAERAVAIAPNYALAHAVLATSTALRYFLHSPVDAAIEAQVQASIDRALALDPENPAVLTYAAQALNFLGRPQDAIGRVERAIRTSPGYGYAYFVCAMTCNLLNRTDEALSRLDVDLRSSPGSYLEYINCYYRAFAHLRGGDLIAAEAALNRSAALNPNPMITPLYQAVVFGLQGRLAEARACIARVRRDEPRTPLGIWKLHLSRALLNYAGLDEVLSNLNALWADTEFA
ncbi:hypothetical protein BH11PSE2_BH11PSE2_21070 [soil metagenome]